jgi:hypothetical protein
LDSAPSYAGPDIPPDAEAGSGGSVLILILLIEEIKVKGYSKLGVQKSRLKMAMDAAKTV